MTTDEIRADMVAELRSAASGCLNIGARQMQLAGSCRSLAGQLNREADRLEAKAETLKSETLKSSIFNRTPANVTGLADENNAEPVTFKLNSAASSSADNFKGDKLQTPNTKHQHLEMERAA